MTLTAVALLCSSLTLIILFDDPSTRVGGLEPEAMQTAFPPPAAPARANCPP